jgi:hypothetical protein
MYCVYKLSQKHRRARAAFITNMTFADIANC